MSLIFFLFLFLVLVMVVMASSSCAMARKHDSSSSSWWELSFPNKGWWRINPFFPRKSSEERQDADPSRAQDRRVSSVLSSSTPPVPTKTESDVTTTNGSDSMGSPRPFSPIAEEGPFNTTKDDIHDPARPRYLSLRSDHRPPGGEREEEMWIPNRNVDVNVPYEDPNGLVMDRITNASYDPFSEGLRLSKRVHRKECPITIFTLGFPGYPILSPPDHPANHPLDTSFDCMASQCDPYRYWDSPLLSPSLRWKKEGMVPIHPISSAVTRTPTIQKEKGSLFITPPFFQEKEQRQNETPHSLSETP